MKKERDYRLDNAKCLMIFLVVFGHLIEPLIDQNLIKVVWMTIYSFHMPVFVIVSGIFSKPKNSVQDLAKLIRNILVPLIAFTILYEAFNLAANGEISNYTKKLQPYWILWFLYSLFIWRLVLPVLLSFRFPLLLAVIVAVASGYFSAIGYFLGLSRTLYFFPFFVVGYRLSLIVLPDIKLSVMVKILLFLIIFMNLLLFICFHDIQHQWLYGSYSFAKLGVNGWLAASARLGLMSLSFLTAMSILFLIPAKNFWFSANGENSVTAYLWHGFVIKILISSGVVAFIGEFSVVTILLSFVVLAFAIVLLFSSGFIKKMTKRFIYLPFQKLLLYKP